jgi:hypothetical protein
MNITGLEWTKLVQDHIHCLALVMMMIKHQVQVRGSTTVFGSYVK